jgi:hypothetical protein
MKESRFEQEIDDRISSAQERFRVGQVSAVVGSRVTVTTSGGASMTIPRLSTWTPAALDIVLIALTPAGWIAIGKIVP